MSNVLVFTIYSFSASSYYTVVTTFFHSNFKNRYGSIVTHCWFDDGHIMLGFSEGFLVVISTHTDEIGEELHSGRFHRTALTAVAYSPKLKLAAVAGDGGLKIVDCSKGFDEVFEPEDVPLPRPNGRCVCGGGVNNGVCA